MSEPDADRAAPATSPRLLTSHSGPVFQGRHSRFHKSRPLWLLHLKSQAERLRAFGRAARPDTFAQFVGFPRSGHSLIGALIDAHPDAVIAHELDAMGLFHKGWPIGRINWLIQANARVFAENGKWWNGFSYAVDGAAEQTRTPRLIGDKKGDWAARWCAADPDLITRLPAQTTARCPWILVTRHPQDNVATMSLRRGGAYDRLRIATETGFGAAMAKAQTEGRIATEASDAMVADYRALCASVAGMKARVPAGDWYEIVYEDFVAAPREGLTDLAAFLGLRADAAWCEAAAALVHASPNRSRDRLSWTDAQVDALRQTIGSRDFLNRYADDI